MSNCVDAASSNYAIVAMILIFIVSAGLLLYGIWKD